jgi:hypothetical protein
MQLRWLNQKQLFSCSIWGFGSFSSNTPCAKRGLRMPQMCGIWASLSLGREDWTPFAHCDYNNLYFAHGSVSTLHVSLN